MPRRQSDFLQNSPEPVPTINIIRPGCSGPVSGCCATDHQVEAPLQDIRKNTVLFFYLKKTLFVIFQFGESHRPRARSTGFGHAV